MGLLKAAIRDPNPVMLFEHKFLYRRIKSVLPEGDAVGRLGEARVMRPGRHLTLIGYGATTWTCLEAAEELAKSGVEAEVIDLRTLVPYDEETVLASVKKTGRALVVHEAPAHPGLRRRGGRPPRRRRLPLARRPDPPRRLSRTGRCPTPRIWRRCCCRTRRRCVAAARELLAFWRVWERRLPAAHQGSPRMRRRLPYLLLGAAPPARRSASRAP